VRAVAVGESRADRQATLAELDEIGTALGQYAARSGSRLQRLSRAGGGVVVAPHRRRWVDALGLVGAGLLGMLTFQLSGALPSLPELPFGALPGMLLALVAALAEGQRVSREALLAVRDDAAPVIAVLDQADAAVIARLLRALEQDG
jgi:hypothetical protein